jgi:hypothetical protein
MRTLRYASLGFLLGFAWGVVARVWMRLISTSPEFSWAGTLGIFAATGICGLALGVIHAARRRRGSGWWRLLYLLVPVPFAGAGLPLLPAVVLGGWGLRRGPFGRIVAALAILSAPVILVAMTWDEVNHWVTPYPENVYRAVLAAGGLVLSGTAAWASSIALGPWRRGRTTALEPNQAAAVAA